MGAGLEAPWVSPHPSTEVGGFFLESCLPWRQPRNLICLWMHMGARDVSLSPKRYLACYPPEASPRPSSPAGTPVLPLSDATAPAPGSPVPCLASPAAQHATLLMLTLLCP